MTTEEIKNKAAKKTGLKHFAQFEDDYRPDKLTLKLIEEIISICKTDKDNNH
jgi:hypothetical protein